MSAYQEVERMHREAQPGSSCWKTCAEALAMWDAGYSVNMEQVARKARAACAPTGSALHPTEPGSREEGGQR